MPLLQTKADASAWGYGFLGVTASTSNFYQIQQLSPSAVSTVTFSGIPSTYKSLQVRFNLTTSVSSYWQIQFNGDTAGNYPYHNLYSIGSTTGASGAASQTALFISNGHTVTTYPNVGIADIVDYANTNKNKTIKAISGSNNNTAGGVGAGNIELASGAWLSTAAITSLTFFVGSGTFTGTITLYGVS